jgi:hypothetical protein
VTVTVTVTVTTARMPDTDGSVVRPWRVVRD